MRPSPPGRARSRWVASASRRSSAPWSPSSAPHMRATQLALPSRWMVAGSAPFSDTPMTHTLSYAVAPAHDDVPPLAARVDLLSGEGALDVFRRAMELEHAGRSIVHLELGAPDVDAPSHVVDAAVAALRAGDARYVAPQGLPELREAIAAAEREDGGVLRNARDGRAGERGARPRPRLSDLPVDGALRWRRADRLRARCAQRAGRRRHRDAHRPAHAGALSQLAQQSHRRRARCHGHGAA